MPEKTLLQNRIEYLEAERRLEVKQHTRRLEKLDRELAERRAQLAEGRTDV